MTDEDDIFANWFSCSNPAASSSDQSATPADQCPKTKQNYQLITARSKCCPFPAGSLPYLRRAKANLYG